LPICEAAAASKDFRLGEPAKFVDDLLQPRFSQSVLTSFRRRMKVLAQIACVFNPKSGDLLLKTMYAFSDYSQLHERHYRMLMAEISATFRFYIIQREEQGSEVQGSSRHSIMLNRTSMLVPVWRS
jgi:hypothetical protein